MDFGSALEEAKNGHPIRRRGWNGKGMWVAIRSGYEILIPSQPGHYPHSLSRGCASIRHG